MTRLAEAVSLAKRQQQDMGVFIASNFPNTAKAFRMIDLENSIPKRRKGFNLVKVESKKHVFLYYARFSHNGKMLPTKWNTHTNDLEKAEKFAIENKSRLVEGYLQRQDGRIYAMLENFYEDKANTSSIYSRHLSERCRKEYRASIARRFVPFLKLEKIACFEHITAAALNKFQDHLLSGNVKPQTANNDMKAVKKALALLFRKGIIKENPGDRIKGLTVCHEDRKARGCYELDKLKGVFGKRWKDDTALLLCLLIYTTGIRNSEINRMRLEDITSIGGCHFVQINKSKTASGVRLVPLHEFALRKLKAWAAKHKKKPQDFLFGFRRTEVFTNAASCLRKQIGISEEEAAAQNITFYSGRHFFKTLMSREGLGEDIEEIFMGHKVTGNVAKLYNHRDKHGKQMLAKKAKQVFSILDRCVFKTKP